MPELSGWRIVWTIVMFDLPTGSSEERRQYTQFRGMLLGEGFLMIQYSVYARCDSGEEKGEALVRRIKAALPPDGEVRILQITDRQYGRMLSFIGEASKPPEKGPEQLEFF